MATQICDLRKEKGVAASIPKNFYRRKTIHGKAVNEWVDKEKGKENKDDNALIIISIDFTRATKV